ncbi:acrosomal protein SP-10-like [Onychomys torridus]|uniref:acrosomal protein SP-10-like n=1 Tax=Onychomys torridus TaxID=38674 RepID=UPI00167F28DA|nr:acrosomal protein SP-10-like [Onychomys torridus]
METLLKLCLCILCFETAFTLQCVLCPSYKNGECVNGSQTCFAQPGETCMIRRIWNSIGYNKLKSVELRCAEFCEFDEKSSGGETIHTYCCNYDDFCNSIDLPIVMT